MKKILIIILILTLFIAGCGTTTKESFDEEPNINIIETPGITSVPCAAKIVTSEDVLSRTVVTGYPASIESVAAINIYDNANTLLASGSANADGSFEITLADNLNTILVLTATAPGKEVSPTLEIITKL